jgi:type III restriction enzyme
MCRRFFSDRALFEQAATSRSVTDFLVRLTTGVSVLVEIKGEEDERDRAKHQAARRWISAVNHWGREGQWEFVVCRDPQQLGNMLARLAAPAQSA